MATNQPPLTRQHLVDYMDEGRDSTCALPSDHPLYSFDLESSVASRPSFLQTDQSGLNWGFYRYSDDQFIAYSPPLFDRVVLGALITRDDSDESGAVVDVVTGSL